MEIVAELLMEPLNSRVPPEIEALLEAAARAGSDPAMGCGWKPGVQRIPMNSPETAAPRLYPAMNCIFSLAGGRRTGRLSVHFGNPAGSLCPVGFASPPLGGFARVVWNGPGFNSMRVRSQAIGRIVPLSGGRKPRSCRTISIGGRKRRLGSHAPCAGVVGVRKKGQKTMPIGGIDVWETT